MPLILRNVKSVLTRIKGQTAGVRAACHSLIKQLGCGGLQQAADAREVQRGHQAAQILASILVPSAP
jgi:hypothetical protein